MPCVETGLLTQDQIMPRTKQHAKPSTGGRGEGRRVHQTRLTDHAGHPVLRMRYERPEYPIPTDFHAAPVFALQVYTTLDLQLDAVDEPALQERTCGRGRAAGADETNLAQLARFLAQGLDRVQGALPVFDLYERPLPGPLEMIEHQRREIQDRKSRAADPGVLVIPKVVGNDFDRRKFGFFLAIDSDAFKRELPVQQDPRGPMLVTFDRRFPAASSVEIKRRLAGDPDSWRCCTEFLEVCPEKLEIEVIRNQRVSLTKDVGWRYSYSYGAYDEHHRFSSPPLDLALDEDEIGTSESSPGNVILPDESFELDDFVVEQHPAVVTIRSKILTADEEATVRYLVYVSYLTAADNTGLEIAARRFVTGLIKHIRPGLSLELQFRIPAEPTLSSVLCTDRTNPSTGYERDSGVLSSATKFPSETVEERFLDPQASQLPKRVFPINRSAESWQNDPRRSRDDPHQRFLVILDKPDFAGKGGGILFLMTDGGRRRDPTSKWELGAEADFVELQVWRSAGMKEAAERLTMRHQDPL